MHIAITGGTGTLGRAVARELRERGHAVRLLSRSAPARLPAGTAHHTVDLADPDPAALAAALAGVDAVVDAANATKPALLEPVLVEGSRRLARAAAEAGARHQVLVSIVGTDRVPLAYYRAKAAQERALTDAPLPVTVVRSTQVHELVAAVLGATARRHVLPAGRAPLQPVAAREAAVVVADVVEAGPPADRAVVEVTGPETLTLGELSGAWRRTRGGHALSVPLPVGLAGPGGRAVAGGALTSAHPDRRGTTSFERWLAPA